MKEERFTNQIIPITLISREQTNLYLYDVANEYVGCSLYIMIIEKEISVIVNLIETCGHDTRPLFLSLSSIAPSEAVSLFVVLLTMFRKGSGL